MDVGVSGGVWGLEVGYCMMVGGPDEAVERLSPDPRRARTACHARARPRLEPLRPDRRRPLREDGPQRHRVRDDAGLRRGLLALRAVRVRPRQREDRAPLDAGLGGPLLAVRAHRARVRAGGRRARVDRPLRRGLGRGSLDGRGRHRATRADARDLDVALYERFSSRGRERLRRHGSTPRCATSSAATRSRRPTRWPRPRRTPSSRGDRRAGEPARRGPRAAARPPDDGRHLRRHGRSRAPQAPAGLLQPRPRGRAAGALQPDRGVALGHPARRLPRDGEGVDRGALAPRSPTRRCSTKLLEQVRYVPGTFDDDSVFDRLEQELARVRRGRRHRLQPRLLPLDRAGVLRAHRPASWASTASTRSRAPTSAW